MRLATTAEGETDLGDRFDTCALIDLRRGLARHAGLVDWRLLGDASPVFTPTRGRGLAARLMIALAFSPSPA
jgi:hypothetical protein